MKRILEIVLALCLLVSPAAVMAAGPETASPLNGMPVTVAGSGELWFRFDYAGDRSEITVVLVNGNGSNIAFNVLTPEQAKTWWESRPVGRGTVYMIDCETGEPSEMGECESIDLTWVGRFNAAGTYYVQVLNHNPEPKQIQLTVRGTGVTVPPPPQPVRPQPAAPTATPAPPVTPPPPTTLPVTGASDWPY